MGICPRSFSHVAALTWRSTAGSLGLIMLLAFPLVRAHDFNAHFRFNEARRSTIRHTSIETNKSETPVDQISQNHQRPNPVIPVELKLNTDPQPDVTWVSSVPISRLLLRLKLGVSRTGPADPLL
jgi:hypothetical protein